MILRLIKGAFWLVVINAFRVLFGYVTRVQWAIDKASVATGLVVMRNGRTIPNSQRVAIIMREGIKKMREEEEL